MPPQIQEPQPKKAKKRKEKEGRDWTHEEVLMLIEMWSNEEGLYSVSHPNYYKKDRRFNAMTRIKNALEKEGVEVSVDDVNAKIHSLRVYYSTLNNKREQSKRSGAGADEVYKIKWPYFEMMSFLKDNLQPRKTVSNLTLESNNNIESDDTPSQPVAEKMRTSRPKKRLEGQQDEDVQFKKVATAYMQKMSQPEKFQKDLDEVFGEMITKKLQSIPNGQQKEMLKIEIQKLIMNLEFAQFSPPNVPTNQFYPFASTPGSRQHQSNDYSSPVPSPVFSPLHGLSASTLNA